MSVINNQYGISQIDIQNAQFKLDKQEEYLSSNVIQTNSGQLKNFLDMSMSANLSSRYYAEVANRCNSIYSLAFDSGYIPVFLTSTLNGCFRDALRGDYSRFTPQDKKYLPQLIKTKIQRNAPLSIKDLVAVFNHIWDKFASSMPFRSMGKKGHKKSYIRVFEPHKKDGVPHFHALLYIPKAYLYQVKNSFEKYFHAPMNSLQTNLTDEQIANGETNGFQWSLNNPTGYVMKYIQKTFKDLKDDDGLTPLATWYIKHKVRRFLTSRSTIPLWVYRKIFFIKNDLFELSTMINDDDCICEWDFDTKYIRLSNPKREIEITYLNGEYSYKLYGRTIKEKKKEKSYRVRDKPVLRSKFSQKPFIPVEIDGENYTLRDNELRKLPITPAYMSDLQLLNYYNNLDIENTDKTLLHYGITQNECVKRGLIDMPIFSLNDFNTDI